MTKHLIERVKTSTCALYGTAGLADTFLSFGITTLIMPIYNIGLGIDAVLLGWALAIPRVIDAITDPLMGNISDNTRSRFGRRRQYVFAGAVLCAILFPFIWTPPDASQNVVLAYFIGIMCLHSIFYTIFNVPYTALGYEITPNYDERTRIYAWRFYFATMAGATTHWLYKLCLMAGEDEVAGVRVVSWIIAAIVLGFGIIPALFTREQEVVQDQEKVNLFKAVGSTLRNRPFILLMTAYTIIVTTYFSAGALILYINIFHIFGGDKDAAGTMTGLSGSLGVVAAFVGMLVMKKVSEATGKKTAMIISLGIAILGGLSAWFTLTPNMPYLQILSSLIMGMGSMGCWLLVSSILGDVCDDDELNTGLRQEGVYSAASGFVNKIAFAFTAITTGYILKMSGYVEGMDPDPEVGLKMKVIFISVQSLGLLVGLLVMVLFPIGRTRAEETRRILDERKKADTASPQS
ncbi:MFS transporter [Pontiella sulfatireligans]|uniref:Putative symporter YjmB n=1 Tax=Pontiella sulfatireligans TaxID=2750658 RepID=A0A6C2UPI7_9BACT|nr:MFS transporter [Pontiella sulfatireligans]VGO21979.1 putative symporter YjmB [Pontiella sulfatireligans]